MTCQDLSGGHLPPPKPLISIIVPSYNYANFLAERLQSILDQTYSPCELIILDDGSTDGSQTLIRDYLEQADRTATLVFSENNSGHVFTQWQRGVALAQGRYIWIAEADDSAKPELLEQLLGLFQTPRSEGSGEIAFVFCDSIAVNEKNTVLFKQYRNYLATLGDDAIAQGGVFSGKDFHQRFLAIQNIILNASAVLWSTQHLRAAIATCQHQLTELNCAGDWLLYLTACIQGGSVGFLPESLNVHRRHSGSVTFSQKKQIHLDEIKLIHQISLQALGPSPQISWACANYLRKLRLQFAAEDEAIDAQKEYSILLDSATTQPAKKFFGHGLKLPLGRVVAGPANELYPGHQHQISPVSVDLRLATTTSCHQAAADRPQESWFDHTGNKLSLSFDLILLFPEGAIKSLHIQNQHGDTWPVTLYCQASPGLQAKYPELVWAKNSRLSIRQTWQLSPGTTALFLLVQVGDANETLIPIGQLHVGPSQAAPSTLLGGVKDLLLIQGMHRSGTSMLAGLCGTFGANLPTDLLPANRWNAGGYFESQAVVSAHDQLLQACERAWFDIRPLPADWISTPAAKHCAQTLSTHLLLNHARQADRPLVIKDPRLASVWPLWEQMCEQHGLRATHLIVLRPVHEVAASLLARDHIQPKIGAAMWWITVTAILRQARHQAHALITYKEALTQPRVIKHILRDLLGLQLPKLLPAPPDGKPSLEADTALRHHKGRLEELAQDGLAQRCEALYTRLAQCVTIPPDLDLDAPVPELDELMRGYPEWAWLFQRHHALLERMRGLRDSMSQALD